ncbi:MAG: D-alanine--D-alanine ligase [Alphaproteobacteria bacterium]|nr:D-alanine--D-alanine ligase [Alphaproteobacteria bacterium]
MSKLAVAVLLGGPSAEHDVSVLTGLQALEALDPAKYQAFPVYIDLQGQWWVGPTDQNPLRDRRNYLPDEATKRRLTRVHWPVGSARRQGRWWLQTVATPWLGQPQRFAVDAVLPALHGTWGEDGTLQGALAAEGVPVAGSGVGGMALTIHKHHTAVVAASLGIPTVPTVLVRRGECLEAAAAVARLGEFPLFVKPNFLGSSIGVHKVADATALEAALADVLRLDVAALVQPCIESLVEYNVAVRRLANGRVVTSAIERPARQGDSYDFKTKYLSGGGPGKTGEKLGGAKAAALRGIIDATRALNPSELQSGAGATLAQQLRQHAMALFAALDLTGTPRLDFMVNEATGAWYFNEINPTPGSFAFFLWEAAEAEAQTGLTGLLDAMLDEARQRLRSQYRPTDPAMLGGQIFPKRG